MWHVGADAMGGIVVFHVVIEGIMSKVYGVRLVDSPSWPSFYGGEQGLGLLVPVDRIFAALGGCLRDVLVHSLFGSIMLMGCLMWVVL